MPARTIVNIEQCFPFESPRPLQVEIIQSIAAAYEEGKTHAILSAPTGIGKSVIAMTLANHLETAYILTSQKVLQDQYAKDFNIPKIKGKYNYFCARDSRLKCDFGMCIKKKQTCKDCPYRLAWDEAYNSPISVFNYTFFFNSCRAQSYKRVRNLLVLDETHGNEESIIDFFSVALSKEDFLKFQLGKSFMSFPHVSEGQEEKIKWLFEDVLPSFLEKFEREKALFVQMEREEYGFREQSRKCKYLDTIVCMINRFREEFEKENPIVIDQKEDKSIEFKLLFGKSAAQSCLYDYGKKTLSMSATIFSKEIHCRNMGIDPDDAIFVQCPSMFPKENRPIYFLNIGSLAYDKKEKSKPKIAKSVEELLNSHMGQRGIIHTVNYDLADYLSNHLDSKRLICPKGKNRDETIKYFFESTTDDLVLISPSLQEGIDLVDEFSRFFILVKTPYPSLMDPWIKARMAADPDWYTIATITSIVQSSGRSVRSKDDYAIGYILDSSFAYFFHKNQKLFPKWWKEALHMSSEN